jgi:hypothetical protein
MVEEQSGFGLGDAIDIVAEIPVDFWHGARGLGQGAYDGAKGAIHAIRHPIDAIKGLGTFIGETSAKVFIGARDIAENGFDIDAAKDRITNWLISTDPEEFAYSSGHAAGAFDGGLATGMGATAVVKGAISFVQETVILNRLVAAERAAAATAEPGVASSVRYGPHEIGPLDAKTAATFRSGSYTAKVLSQPVTLFRSFGGKAGQLGRYWFREAPMGPMQVQLDGAIMPEWGNNLANVVEVRVPAGTTIYEGATAPQVSNIRSMVGGGNQVFIPRVDPSWIVPPPAVPPPPVVVPAP